MRNQRRVVKISLSEELEQLLFAPVLKKREIEALQERCESYQIGAPRQWSGDVFRAYAQYFGALSALKMKSVLQELDQYGYLNIWDGAPKNIYDFGAGTLGATLGAVDFFKEKGAPIPNAFAFDDDPKPIDWARREFESFLPKSIQAKKLNSFENSLIIASDVFNEMGLMSEREQIDSEGHWFKEIDGWIEKATPTTLIILIEPASKQINRNFLTLRNIISKKIPILLPCTHQKACPALLTNDWCHEERDYKVPSSYWNLVRQMGFRKGLLQFSMLCLGRQTSRFQQEDGRMVSRPIKSKGRCEKWLCADGKRWKSSLLNRNKSEVNEDFFEAARGDIVHCSANGISIPQ
ncbi:MAG: Ribosomal small subunit Rsm22 [Bacteriovoracaceae bacterium]|nr:Ribosomal small subunit Rsm22 [Bacteriovoracaceae bacterium]